MSLGHKIFHAGDLGKYERWVMHGVWQGGNHSIVESFTQLTDWIVKRLVPAGWRVLFER